MSRIFLLVCSLVFGGALAFVSSGCAVKSHPYEQVNPSYLVDEVCHMGMFRATKKQACADELAKRAPVWGRS